MREQGKCDYIIGEPVVFQGSDVLSRYCHALAMNSCHTLRLHQEHTHIGHRNLDPNHTPSAPSSSQLVPTQWWPLSLTGSSAGFYVQLRYGSSGFSCGKKYESTLSFQYACLIACDSVWLLCQFACRGMTAHTFSPNCLLSRPPNGWNPASFFMVCSDSSRV